MNSSPDTLNITLHEDCYSPYPQITYREGKGGKLDKQIDSRVFGKMPHHVYKYS
jgi:hypothetical protein